MSTPCPRALTIAGSDSGGGAGIQADLKTFSMLGVYGMSAITAITAQNTQGVYGIHDIPPDMITRQIDLVIGDIGVDAVKIGMLSNTATIEAVAHCLTRAAVERLVVDPVMLAKSGDALLQDSAVDALKRLLLPLALVVTPNVPEAEVLSGRTIAGPEDVLPAAEAIKALGPKYVLLKGGHLHGPEATDYLYDGRDLTPYRSIRLNSTNTHGTGCTFASAIAAHLARGEEVPAAVRYAKCYLMGAIRKALPLGQGHGPVNHLWMISDKSIQDVIRERD
ncbi:MAG: bifunctional hydroxymethylpyrimidine kinase/phosphomethylpyrimidine kinase [Candidatus Hydrogenedentes bacterium]|nr:bifunctional hydroxymethylpyrimidine kinase/phosphomethylpyrimidine kinase [Candidatus Hydrogenedentota bacterium]